MNIKMKMIAMRRYMKIENMTQNIIIGDFRQNNPCLTLPLRHVLVIGIRHIT